MKQAPILFFNILILTFASVQAQPFQWGLAARQGDRPTMEDEHTHQVRTHDAFFALYDGHGGDQAAKYAANNLYKHFFNKQLKNATKIEQNLVDAFEQTDQEILRKSPEPSGAVAVAVYLTGQESNADARNQAYIAWAGDSRALIVRNGNVIFHTIDHKPDAPEELLRLQKIGLRPIKSGNAFRIGGLAVSRALGDSAIKRIVGKGGVIATPETHTVTIQSGDVIILACDGVWDVISNEQAAKLVSDIVTKKITLPNVNKEYPKEPGKRKPNEEAKPLEQGDNAILETAARALRDDAYNKGSTDNISAMVILYSAEARKPQESGIHPKPEEEKKEKEEIRHTKPQPGKIGAPSGLEIKEEKVPVSSVPAPVPMVERQVVIDRLIELHKVMTQNKLQNTASAVENVLDLIKSQPYTIDVLRLSQELLNDVNGDASIKYRNNITTIKTLLDPIKDNISRDIKRLESAAKPNMQESKK